MGKHKNKIKLEPVEDDGMIQEPEPQKAPEEAAPKRRIFDDIGKKKKEIHRTTKIGILESRSRYKSYDVYLKHLKKHPNCGLFEMTEIRHMALPYHTMLDEEFHAGPQFIANSTLGKYRRTVDGVVFAIKSVELVGLPIILDEQTVYHADYRIKMIVFKPNKDTPIRCTIQHISKNFMSLTYLECVQVKIFGTEKWKHKLNGHVLQLGDQLLVRPLHTETRGTAMAVVAGFMKVLTRTATEREVAAGHSFKRSKIFPDDEAEVPAAEQVEAPTDIPTETQAEAPADSQAETPKRTKKKRKHSETEIKTEEVTPEVQPKKSKKSKLIE
ncbi:unnamed protein product, partial [Mesorhabditis spiculigera]